jgi:heptosyltransferase-1
MKIGACLLLEHHPHLPFLPHQGGRSFGERHFQVKNILIIKLSAIGDVVQALPALESIKRTFPACSVTWVVEEAAAGILEGHPLIDTVLVSGGKSWLRMLGHPRTFREGFLKIAAFLRALRATRYDIALDLQGLFKSGVVVGLANADRKIGFDRSRELSSLFLNERLPAYDIEKHALERYLDAARYLGAREISSSCTLPIGRERSEMQQRLSDASLKRKPLIVINPVARWETKLWPEQNFAELADRLIAEKQATIIFTGSRSDHATVSRILNMMKHHAENWAGETTLKELAALASLADLFVTTDTGPMHVAAAVNAKVMALFGPTAPWRTGPYGPSNIVVRAELECAPCFKRRCKDGIRCMGSISVDEVMRKVPL